MAYGFNNDRSKAPMYTSDQIDIMIDGGGGGGGGGLFLVEVETSSVSDLISVVSADKTFDEITEAIEDGMGVVLHDPGYGYVALKIFDEYKIEFARFDGLPHIRNASSASAIYRSYVCLQDDTWECIEDKYRSCNCPDVLILDIYKDPLNSNAFTLNISAEDLFAAYYSGTPIVISDYDVNYENENSYTLMGIDSVSMAHPTGESVSYTFTPSGSYQYQGVFVANDNDQHPYWSSGLTPQ